MITFVIKVKLRNNFKNASDFLVNYIFKVILIQKEDEK